MFKQLILISIFIFSVGEVYGQNDTIYLNNWSFESFPRASMAPRGWFDCGGINFPLESPPDVHPSADTAFGVKKAAVEGDTYLGLVVRENDSWESVSQRLNAPLEASKCYKFSIYLARSQFYQSQLRNKEGTVNFTAPLKLRIWGGSGYCNKRELLDESSLVTNAQWKEYLFEFRPTQRHTYIILEAFFQTPAIVPPNGNLLLDNASPIILMPCDEKAKPIVRKPEVDITNPSGKNITVSKKSFQLIASILNVKGSRDISLKVNGASNRRFDFDPLTNKLKLKLNLREGDNVVTINAKNSTGNAGDRTTIIYKPPVVNEVVVTKEDPDPEPEIIRNLKNLGEGETIRVDELYFDVDSYEITQVSKPVLEDIYRFMKENANVTVEIGGHTNRNCSYDFCQKLSTNRARAVVHYLVGRGIDDSRLKYKGYGKSKPITFSSSAEMQKKNQRVEIKILSLGG